ncbi:MAG: hypothetical protein JWN44_2168 [Myxococcales bacterium]|nr:hypothetical protein [Myxococcales bacterium]
MKSCIVVLIAFAGFGAVASEKKVAEKEVPKAALDAVSHKYPNAKRVGFEREDTGKSVSYEVKLVDNARKIDVDVSGDGKILAEEEVIAMTEVPSAVRDALAKSPKYGKWTVKKVERVIKDEKTDAPLYEIVVTSDKSKAEVVFAKDGTLVSTENGAGD